MSWVFEKIIRIDKSLAKLTEWKRTHVIKSKTKLEILHHMLKKFSKSKGYIVKVYTSLNLKNINEILYF